MAFLGYDFLDQRRRRGNQFGRGLPRPINQVPGGMQSIGYNLPRRDDAFGNPRNEPWYKLQPGADLQAHNRNVDQQWAPWFGGRALSPDERRLVNPPAFTAPRKRFSREQIWKPKPGDYMAGDVSATGRPVRTGPRGGESTPRPSGKGRWVSGAGTVSKRDEFTPEMENVRSELYALGYPNLTGDVDFNPQWGTTGGIGMERLGAAPPVTKPPDPNFLGGDRLLPTPIGGRAASALDSTGQATRALDSIGQAAGALDSAGRQRTRGQAAGDPVRQQTSGQAAGDPPVLENYDDWDQADRMFRDHPDGGFAEQWRNRWKTIRDNNIPIDWNDPVWQKMWTTRGSMGKDDVVHYLDEIIRAWKFEQDNPTDEPVNTEDIPTLADRDLSEGTGTPWAQDIPDPFSQDAPQWARDAVENYGVLMPQIIDQYRAIANLGIYGPAGMQTIRAPRSNATDRILSSLEPFINETTQGIRQSEANQRRRAGQALSATLGRVAAQRPGLAAQSIATNVTAPSLVAESERIFGARQQAKGMADALIMDQGVFDSSLTERNMASKAGIGLPGMQGALGQQAAINAQRPWDLSMENKFGWAPERTAEIQTRVSDYLMSKGFAQNWNMANQNALLGDWGLGNSQERMFDFQKQLQLLDQNFRREMQDAAGGGWFSALMGALQFGGEMYANWQTGGYYSAARRGLQTVD